MASTPVFSFQDAANLLWQSFNPATKPPTGRELQMAKAAIVTAYRDLANIYPWSYYRRKTTIRTQADQSNSTVTYRHTGGAYERMLTIAATNWPVEAARGTIILNDVHYDVEDYKSSTIITLSANSNPGEDLAAGTTYQWYRDSYPLPVNFRSVQEIVDCSLPSRYLEYLDSASLHSISRDWTGVGDPDSYTIRNEGDYIGSQSIVFSPAPDSKRSYDILYDAVPNQLTTYKYSTGTVSCTAASTTVTGTGTVWAAQHKGCVIRFSSDSSTEPTDVVGTVDGTNNPFLAQRIVTSVTDSATLVIDAAVSATSTLTNVKYTLSDPIDVEPITMRSYFEALAMYHYARLTKRKEQRDLMTYAHKCLLEAMAADTRSRQVITAGMSGYGRGWADRWGDVDYDGT